MGARIIGARRLPGSLDRVANAFCRETLRGHWPRRATRIACACFALGPCSRGRQFGAGYLRRRPIIEAWARRGRCLPLVALTGASDAQETIPGGGQEMRPGGWLRVDYRGAGPWPEGRGLGARHEVSACILVPRRAAGPAFCRETLRGRGPPAWRRGVPGRGRGAGSGLARGLITNRTLSALLIRIRTTRPPV